MVAKLWRWRGDGCLSSELIFSLLWTLIASIDIHDLQSLCELHKPRLLSPLTTLYRAGCHALNTYLLRTYMDHLLAVCAVCVSGWVWRVLHPFYPISLWTSLDNSLTQCIGQRPSVFLQRQRKSGLKLHSRWFRAFRDIFQMSAALWQGSKMLASWTMGCWYLLSHPLACQVVWQSSLVSGLGFRRTATMFQVRCENSPCSSKWPCGFKS